MRGTEATPQSGRLGGSAEDRLLLRKVYQALDTLQDDRVKRQDLLSIAAKVQDKSILEAIRASPWLHDLLQPERWGKNILKTSFSRTGSITCDSFITFWEDYQQEPASESESQFTRRDTFGSIDSFGSAGSEYYRPHNHHRQNNTGLQQQLRQQQQQPRQQQEQLEAISPNPSNQAVVQYEEIKFNQETNGHKINERLTGNTARVDVNTPPLSHQSRPLPPQGTRKILRALSVSSKSSSGGVVAALTTSSETRTPVVTNTQGHKPAQLAMQSAFTPQLDQGARVSVRANLQLLGISNSSSSQFADSPPQIVVVTGTFGQFVDSLAQRLGFTWSDDFILVHSLLRAQVLRLEDLREGDQLEVVRRDIFRAAPAFTVSRTGVKQGVAPASNSKGDVHHGGHVEDERNERSGNENESTKSEKINIKEVSPFATFVRRPSWKDHYDSQPLPSTVRHSIRSILKRVSTSSSRWQHIAPQGSCPDEDTLRNRLSEFVSTEKRKKLSIDRVIAGVDKLDLQYGLGRNHTRLLFVAVDQESTGTISVRHFQDMILLWREVWAEHQAVLRLRAAEAEAEEKARQEEAERRLQEANALSSGDAAPPFNSNIEKSNLHEDSLELSKSSDSDSEDETGLVRPRGHTPATSTEANSAALRPKTPGSLSSSKSSLSQPNQRRPKTANNEPQNTSRVPFYSKVSQTTTHNKHMSRNAMNKEKRIMQARTAANQYSLASVRPSSAMPATAIISDRLQGVDRRRPPRTPSNHRRHSIERSEDILSRPSTAPSSGSHFSRRGPTHPALQTEEEYLRAMHESKGEDPVLLVGYASLLLNQVRRRTGYLHVPKVHQQSQTSAWSPKTGLQVFDEEHQRVENTIDAAHRRKMDKARQFLKRALHASKLAENRNTVDWAETRAEILCKLGEICEIERDVGQARTFFHKAVQEDPRSPHILCKYGTFLHKLGDTAGAKEYLLEALVHDRNCIDALLGYAILMSRSPDPCDHKLAAQYFERARKNARQNRAPKDTRARVLGQVAIYQNMVLGQHQEAAQSFEKAVQLDETFVDAWYELGRLRFAALDDAEGAVEAFKAALEHSQTHLPSLIALAQILANSAARGDVERAEELFTQALELDPNNTRVLLSYAEFLANVSKSEIRAESAYSQALANAASEDLKGLCYMKMAAFFEKRTTRAIDVGNLTKAVEYYESALKVVGSVQRGACLVALGRCKAEMGHLEQAREALEKALAVDSSSIEAKWRLASVEQRCGKRGAAGKLFRVAFEEAPNDGYVLTHFAHFLLDYRGPTDDRQLVVAESMLRKALEVAKPEKGSSSAFSSTVPSVNSSSEDFKPLALTLLGKLLARDPSRRKNGLELLEQALEERPRAYDTCYSLALVLSENAILSRAVLYQGREQKSAQQTLERCIQLFITASELQDTSVDAPLRAAALLLCIAETYDDPLERQSSLERALKYGERAVRRASRAQRKSSNRPLASRQAEANYLCGIALERQRRFGEATTNFLDAITLNPSHVLAMYHASRRKEIDLDDLEGAQRLCMDALTISPLTHVGKVDHSVLCQRVLRDYELAEARFMIVDGEREDPAAARALVMHQQLAQKAQEVSSSSSCKK